MSVLNHEIIGDRYFFPRRATLPNTRWVDVAGARLSCFESQQGNPVTVVHFHGNGEVCADYVPEFPALMNSHGADTFLAEYRGYGESTGAPRLQRMLEDTEAIFEAVARPASEIVVFGRSVGSIYAIEFAKRYNVGGLVLESGIADVAERIKLRASPRELGLTEALLDAEFRAHFDHARKLAGRALPTLVLHTRGDSMVAASHGERLASYPKSNVRLMMFERGDHNTIFAANREAYIAELADLLTLVRDGGSYQSEADTTQDGGIAVFEDTQEFASPDKLRRSGPGQTVQIKVPESLRKGPSDTIETRQLADDDSEQP